VRTVPIGLVNQRKIAKDIAAAAALLAPEVVRIRHNIGEDWSGDEAIFFRIVLSDAASREDTLRAVTTRIENVLLKKVQPLERWGLLPYFSFRSQSEQAEINEEAWA
jgi:hypothetical protein